MFNLTRKITNWRSLAVLAGLLTVMATDVASASHGQGPRGRQQCAACVGGGPQKCNLHAHGHRAKKQYRRGYAAGKQAGWQAGYADGRNGCVYAGYAKQRLTRRHVQYQVGFRAGYANAYAEGYRRGRADSRPRHGHRRGFWWSWDFDW